MDCDELLKIMGERIRTLRKSRKLSQEVLAERANLHPIFVSKVETGKVKASICTYSAIARALGVTLAELTELPGEGEAWDSNLVALFQAAKRLGAEKQKVFVETVRGVLNGLGGL
jgi:transcriptional regulator with XRE-family HTH domain